MFKDWTWFERIWLLVFTAINIYLFFAWDDTLLGLISSLTGMICVVLVAKGKISNYYFGIIQTSTYAYISFTYGVYGEAMLNGLFYFPLQFVGLYLWSRSRNKLSDSKSVQGEDIVVKKLTKNQWMTILTISVVAIALYGWFLRIIGGTSVWLDASTNVLSVAAQLLMLFRMAEQWYFWIAVNILSIAIWVIVSVTQEAGDTTLVVMWTAFLVNSVYGLYNWNKMAKKHEEKGLKD